jgi:hypothetical protein
MVRGESIHGQVLLAKQADDITIFTDLITVAAGETELEIQDRVRRVIPPSGVLFVLGRMFLTRKGAEALAQAVLDGRIEGKPDRARVVLNSTAIKFATRGIARPVVVREICEAILDGRMEGNRDMARDMLDSMNRHHPTS